VTDLQGRWEEQERVIGRTKRALTTKMSTMKSPLSEGVPLLVCGATGIGGPEKHGEGVGGVKG